MIFHELPANICSADFRRSYYKFNFDFKLFTLNETLPPTEL